MPRNYDTTNHKPFPDIIEAVVRYNAAGVQSIEYTEQDAVLDGEGKVRHLSSGTVRYVLDMSKISEPVDCVDLQTGAVIPGMTATSSRLQLDLMAFIRADQRRRDAETA